MAKGPVFQHRHYKAIAALIAVNMQGWEDRDSVSAQFAIMFQDDNPRFDRARFLAAANGKPSNGRDKVK
jgi:hypothetical protein